jgi:acylphosphatase
MDNPEFFRLHAFVDGQVQGVGYRVFVSDLADVLKLNGWVRNLWDGRVEVVAEGERPILESFLTQLKRGPRGAYVTQVEATWEPACGEYNQFMVRRTA